MAQCKHCVRFSNLVDANYLFSWRAFTFYSLSNLSSIMADMVKPWYFWKKKLWVHFLDCIYQSHNLSFAFQTLLSHDRSLFSSVSEGSSDTTPHQHHEQCVQITWLCVVDNKCKKILQITLLFHFFYGGTTIEWAKTSRFRPQLCYD